MIEIVIGNIVDEATDAIVNAANEMLLPGSGISGAIHAAAGNHLAIECEQIGSCATADACITAGYNLRAKFVIHAVAPRYWDGARDEAELLRKTYRAIFELALEHRIKSIAIPAIGTGIYRFPILEATKIAFQEARVFEKYLEIKFVCFDEKTYQIYLNQAKGSSHQSVTLK